MITQQRYKFTHGAMSIIQMGEELIGHPTTALNELVKNSYDADAFDCWVYVCTPASTEDTFIVVHDNGTGMKNNVLFGDWLKPSMSLKRMGNRKSPVLERNYLGKKGIGRLAAMALGKYLTVVSKSKDENYYNWLTINRDDFKQEVLLDKIDFPGGTTDNIKSLFDSENLKEFKGKSAPQKLLEILNSINATEYIEGTTIIIENIDESVLTIIKKDIDEEKSFEASSFHRSLRFLITPLKLNKKIQEELIAQGFLKSIINIAKPESEFDIHFGSSTYETQSTGDIFSIIKELPILSQYDYRLIGKVDREGNVNGHYICQRLSKYSFDEPFEIPKEDALSTQTLKLIPENISCSTGEFYFDIRVYDRDDDCWDKMETLLKTKGKLETGRVLNNILGLRISKNAFNIKPYGEEQKDWMDLGHMRVQNPTEVIDKNQILGNVILFSPENDSLEEKTNREGFFETKAFIDLKTILKAVLLELGKRRYRYRVKYGIGRIITSKFKRPDSAKFISFLKNQTTDLELIKKAEVYVKETNTTLENLENSLTFSERLAALGNGLELVYHELAQPITLMSSSISSLEHNIKNKIKEITFRQTLLTDLVNSNNNLESIDELRKSLQPAIGKSRPASFFPYKTFQKVRLLHNLELKEKNIQINVDDQTKLAKLSSYEFVFWISFLNIFNNAVYWLEETDPAKREITFKVRDDSYIEISNSSPFIPSDYLETIFEYGVTFKKSKNATGLGLAYTRSQLNKVGYEIWAENNDNGPVFFINKIKEDE
ncbi:MAG: sensor histidine kinase [Prolixibacteraceae bacterium]|nr:sensor histidine kinase [Prolixibacteraceae bacterium]